MVKTNEIFEFDAIIIGAGIIGLAIANELASTLNNILVVEKESDLVEIKQLIQKHRLSQDRVLLMTQAITKEEMLAREKNVFFMAKKSNLGFSPRMHVIKWGNQRGT